MEDLKLHTVSSSMAPCSGLLPAIWATPMPVSRTRKYISQTNDWRYCHDWMQQPPTCESWEGFRTKPFEWFKEVEAGKETNPFDSSVPVKPYRPSKA